MKMDLVKGSSNAQHLPQTTDTDNETEAEESLLLTCPDEIILKILSNLREKDLASASHSCLRLYVISNDNFLWKNLFFKIFPSRAAKVTPLPMIQWKSFHQTAYRIESNFVKGICEEKTLPAHPARITSIVQQPPYLLTADCEGTIKINTPNPDRTYDEIQTIAGSVGGAIQSHPETELIAFPTEDGSVQLMRKPSAAEPFVILQTLPGDGSKIGQFFIEKEHVFFLTENNNFYIWTKDLTGQYVNAVSLPSIRKFVCSSNDVTFLKIDNSIDIFKIKADKTLEYSHSPTETTDPFEHVCGLLSTTDHLFLYNIHGKLKVFAKDEHGQLKEIQVLPIITQFLDSITHVHVHEDYLITGNLKGGVKIFRKQESKEYEEIPCAALHSERINQIVMKENFLCIGSTDSKTSILKKNALGTFDLLTTLSNLEQAVTSVCIEEDRFISGHADGQMRIWDFT